MRISGILLLTSLLLFLSSCSNYKQLKPSLKTETDRILQKYLPKFELPSSITIYNEKMVIPGGCAHAGVASYAFGLWKSHWIGIESEEEFERFSPSVREFVICHELAHIKLEHCQPYYWWQEPTTTDLALQRTKEYEADKLAVQMMGSSIGAVKFFVGKALIDIGIVLAFVFLILCTAVLIYCFLRNKRIQYKKAWKLIVIAILIYVCREIIKMPFSTHPPHLLRALHVLFA